MTKIMKSTLGVVMSMSLTGLVACEPAPDAPASTSNEPGLTHTDGVVGKVMASDDTRASTGVASWEVYRDASGRLAVVATDMAGQRINALEVAKVNESLNIAADAGILALNHKGEVLENSLSPHSRVLLQRMSDDLNGAQVQYGWLGCGASVLAVIASSAACGATLGAACLAVPAAFCVGSKHCGNDVCDW